jgi:RNA polymerase-binding transcription factor DksA
MVSWPHPGRAGEERPAACPRAAPGGAAARRSREAKGKPRNRAQSARPRSGQWRGGAPPKPRVAWQARRPPPTARSHRPAPGRETGGRRRGPAVRPAPPGLVRRRRRACTASQPARRGAAAAPRLDAARPGAVRAARSEEGRSQDVPNDLRSGQESNDSPTEDIVDRANNAYSRELNFSISDAERADAQVDERRSTHTRHHGSCAHCGYPSPSGWTRSRAALHPVPGARSRARRGPAAGTGDRGR